MNLTTLQRRYNYHGLSYWKLQAKAMDQRRILELILGVYKLDKKYRSNPANKTKSLKKKRSKYTRFQPDYEQEEDESDQLTIDDNASYYQRSELDQPLNNYSSPTHRQTPLNLKHSISMNEPEFEDEFGDSLEESEILSANDNTHQSPLNQSSDQSESDEYGSISSVSLNQLANEAHRCFGFNNAQPLAFQTSTSSLQRTTETPKNAQLYTNESASEANDQSGIHVTKQKQSRNTKEQRLQQPANSLDQLSVNSPKTASQRSIRLAMQSTRKSPQGTLAMRGQKQKEIDPPLVMQRQESYRVQLDEGREQSNNMSRRSNRTNQTPSNKGSANRKLFTEQTNLYEGYSVLNETRDDLTALSRQDSFISQVTDAFTRSKATWDTIQTANWQLWKFVGELSSRFTSGQYDTIGLRGQSLSSSNQGSDLDLDLSTYSDKQTNTRSTPKKNRKGSITQTSVDKIGASSMKRDQFGQDNEFTLSKQEQTEQLDYCFREKADQLSRVSNVGLIQQKVLKGYLKDYCLGPVKPSRVPYHIYYPQVDDSLSKLLIDYVIQAYSYEFSVIRVQQGNILVRLQSVLSGLVDEFDLSREDFELAEELQHNIGQIEERNREVRVKTMFCCGRVMGNHSEKFVICAQCGRMCNYQKKSIRKDRNEGVQRNTSYHSIRHFDDVFKQLFFQPLEPIDSITKLQLQEFMERDQKQKVNIEDVRQYLKQLPGGKGSKLNKSDAFIMGLLNGEVLNISSVEYLFIKNTFQQFIQILYKNAETRKNTPNCVSFIRKIIDLLYKDFDAFRHQQIVKRLHQQKENTTRKMQKIWLFLLSQIDVNQIKRQFKETIIQSGSHWSNNSLQF